MNKKIVVICIVAGLLVVGGIIGFLCYRNTPNYVMKQYVRAINNRNQKTLEKIIYTANQFQIIDINDAYDRKRIFEITSYKTSGEIVSDIDLIEGFKSIHYKYPDKINSKISKTITYEINNTKEDRHDWISIVCVDEKWKIAVTQLLVYK